MKSNLQYISATIFHSGDVMVNFQRNDNKLMRTYRIGTDHKVNKIIERLSHERNTRTSVILNTNCTFICVYLI